MSSFFQSSTTPNDPNDTGFFYGEATPPEANSTDQLIDALEAQLAQVTEDSSTASAAANSAASSARNAAISEANVATLGQQANDTLAAANSTLATANAAASSASASAATATTKAQTATDAATSAINSRDAAAASQTAAAASQTAAAGSATSASTSAGTATTQAGNAATSAATATTQAGTATTQAGISTTQAGISTTQAGNASTSAATATTQAGIATTQAGNSATSAAASLASKNAAATSETNAAASAAAAATSASIIDPNTYVKKDGTSTMTGNLQMGSKKVTGLADGTAAGDATSKSQMDTADNLRLLKAGGDVSGEIISTTQNNQRIIQGNYGAFWRNDGTNFYLLKTASGDQRGNFDSKRPLAVDLASGNLALCSDGSTVTTGGVLRVSGGNSSTLGALMLSAGSNAYNPVIRANSGNTSIEWVNNANNAVNLTLSDGGNLTVRGTTATAGLSSSGLSTFSSQLWMQSANSIRLDGGTYSGYLRGDSSGLVGFINQAQNNFNLTIADSGFVNFPRARPQWAGLTPWDNGNLSQPAQLNVDALFAALVQAAGMRTQNSTGTYAGRGGGAYYGWNDTGGSGEGVLTCNNAGSAGGWTIRTVNSNNSAEVGRFVISPAGVGTNGSDIRLKENVETLTGSLDKLRSIRGVSYSYKSNGEKHYGVIAQEVQTAFPDAVSETHGPAEGSEDDYLGVSYNDLIGPLIEAVKELANKLDVANARLAVLEAK